MSLRQKLIAVVMFTCVVSLMLAGTVFLAWEWAELRRTMIHDLAAHAEVLANNCKAALTFGDPTDAGACLRTIDAVPCILTADLYDREGEQFATYVRPGTTSFLPPPPTWRSGHRFEREYLLLSRPVLLDGEPIGRVFLRADLHPLYLRLQRSVLALLYLTLLSSLAAYAISSRLQRIISTPILQLAAAARRISERQEYALRVEPASADEVGLLIQAFNEMLGQIQQRDTALVESNERLEGRVQARTAELTAANDKLVREITARRQTDRALAEANMQLAETVKNLRRSNKELQDFAYVTAHDLKAPLRGIGTLADWIATDYAGRLDEQGRQQLRLLKGRVTRLTELINGILQYSEIGHVTNRLEWVDLTQLVPDTIALLDPLPTMQVVIREELPCVWGEKVRLGQIFHNLIDNALKYMDKPQGRIEIGCTDRGDAWEFTVSDNGPGIEAKYFEKIFQMFQTLAPRDQRESTGIGLPIVKKIVELFGGRIWVESTPGTGTTFFFTLPKQEAGATGRTLVTHEASLN